MGKNVYQIVTDRIISKIEKAISTGEPMPWQRPFVYSNNSPRNFLTQKHYQGVNRLLLERGEFLTWNQICDLQKQNSKIHLRKGSTSTPIIYYNFVEKENADTGKTERVPYLRYYNVFSVEDVEGVEAHTPVHFEHGSCEDAERLFQSYIDREQIRLNVQYSNKACYSPLGDTITLPLRTQFRNSEAFYATAFHEAAHSTGSTKRLNRNILNHFGSGDYSKEELVAEMTSGLLMSYLHIETDFSETNNLAYMRNWLKALKDNTTWLVSAAAQAQKAADFIIGIPSGDN